METTRDPAQILEDSLLQRNKQLYTSTSIKHDDSQIQQFYDGATVFITGGTGFIGKHLIEKLLRATNVSKIFILMRPKKGKLIKDRLDEMLKDPVYELLRENIPHFQQKLVPIAGDVAELRLGMSDDDWNVVTHQTEMIFHVAATTRFDETLRIATFTNVRGTRETLLLGTQCTKLRAFVHVSTAYSHTKTDLIESDILEDFYQSPVDPEAMIKFVETIEEERLNNIKSSFIKGWPNTYSFTKAVSEELVRTQGRNLPLCIIRPAIVMGAYREPRPGWVDLSCVYGATGTRAKMVAHLCNLSQLETVLTKEFHQLVAAGIWASIVYPEIKLVLAGCLGFAHAIYIGHDIKLGFVPVDYVNNAIIVAGWETAKRSDEKVKIYTVTLSTRNGMAYGQKQVLFDDAAHEYPLPDSIRFYFITLTKNPVLFFIYTWILNIIPAYIADGVLVISGKKRIAVKMTMKLYIMSKALSYFCTNQWNFKDENLSLLYEKLSPLDKEIFNFDMTDLDWKDYLTIIGMGIRKYIVKDGLTRTNYARKKQTVFSILTLFLFPLYLYILFKIMYLSVWGLVYVLCNIW